MCARATSTRDQAVGPRPAPATRGAPPAVRAVLQAPGEALDASTREVFEPRFQYSFADIRIHADSAAAESARQIGARAFTVQHHIVFGSGQHAPSTPTGAALMAHELAHAVQQSNAAGSALPPDLTISSEGEDGARAAAATVMAGMPVAPPSPGTMPVAVAREPAPGAALGPDFEERVRRIDKLLSYGVFDWAVTDAEATEAFQILKAMSRPERAAALKRFRLDRLIDNLPGQFQSELAAIVAESGGAQEVGSQVQAILTYSLFDLIGYISEAEANRAMGLLEALDPARRDEVLDGLPRDKRKRLHDSLGASGRARFLDMWSEKNERAFARQREELRQIVPGDRFLIQVLLGHTKEPIEAFAPEGTAFDVAPDGSAYFAPLDAWVNLQGLTRAEAERRLERELSAKSSFPLLVTLKRRPENAPEDAFAPTPPARVTAEPAQAARRPEPAPDPYEEKAREFLLIYKSQAEALKALGERWSKTKDNKLWSELEREREALDRFYSWFEAHKTSPKLLKTDLASLLGQLKAGATFAQIQRDVAHKIQMEKEEKAYSPEMQKARLAKMDEFLNLALSLRGESARRFPYRIPVPSEGVDILVTGDPARQAVLDAMAEELMAWSRAHFLDDNYTTVDPKGVLLHILKPGAKGGYQKALADANAKPLQSEVIDRNEIVPERALAAFGKTVATGLAVIALVGAAVGLGIISGGAALVLLGGVAAYSGISSYLERRKEIEEKGYDVPVPVTAVHAAGDIVGITQLVEGITGERVGTNQRLSSVARSDQLGTGAGSVTLLLVGSRAYRFGQGVGQNARAKLPGTVPETLEGVPRKDLGSQYKQLTPPTEPVQNPTPGPKEAAARAALPERLRVGFDRWMEQVRSNPKKKVDVEKMLDKMTRDQIEAICKKPAEDYLAQVEAVRAQAEAKTRSVSDPLRPRLKHREWRDGVTIQYEKVPPSEVEIAHAKEIQGRTGEEVNLFGDTPAQKSYPGIDGTIGTPPRALQLKNLADPAYLKVHAADAFKHAADHGYSKVEVHLRVADKTIAELKAAWEAKPAHPRGHEIGWETRLSMARSKLTLSRLVIEGSDGVWVVDAPLPSPGLPGVSVTPGGTEDKTKPRAPKP